jgi:hypothetical protein
MRLMNRRAVVAAGANGFFLRARLKVSLRGVEREAGQAILDEAAQDLPPIPRR